MSDAVEPTALVKSLDSQGYLKHKLESQQNEQQLSNGVGAPSYGFAPTRAPELTLQGELMSFL